MTYTIHAYDKKDKVEVAVIALFIRSGRIVSVQTSAGVFPAERFTVEIDLEQEKP